MTYPRKRVICSCCGVAGPHGAHGWIRACYLRWLDAGQPSGGPAPALSRSEAIARAQAVVPRSYQERLAGAEARREDYDWLTREQGLTQAEAALRLDVSLRTVQKYEKRKKAE